MYVRYEILATFADLPTLRFNVTPLHPTMEWIEPVMTSPMHYMMLVFDPPESAFTPVLVRVWMLPLIQVGAVYSHQLIHNLRSCHSSDSSDLQAC